MRRPRIARARRRRRGSPPPLASACPPSPPAHRPLSPPAFSRARARPAARACAQATDPPPRAPSPPHALARTHTLRLCDPAPHRPAAPAALPHLSGEGGDPRPPTKHNHPPTQWGEAPRSPSSALCPSRPVTVTQPEGRAAWARAAVARLKAGSPGVRPLGPAGPTGAPRSGLPRARGRGEGAPFRRLPSPRAPTAGPRPACPPSPGRPRRPRRGARAPWARGSSVQRPGPASPTPRRSEGAGNGAGMSVLGSAPRGSSRRLTRASTGAGRQSGLRDGPGAAAAGAPTAGPRRPGRWPWKPLLLGHARVSAAPVPPAARVGRDPAPGESGRPPWRGARAAPATGPTPPPGAAAGAGGPAGKMSPLGARSFARGSATGQRPPEPRRPCPRTGSRGSTAARRARRLGTSTEPGQRRKPGCPKEWKSNPK
uniref:Uncharacterized protein n=1 Tax=Equus caballus TaxID=9796 RepID=A0A9L0SN36_HORSE